MTIGRTRAELFVQSLPSTSIKVDGEHDPIGLFIGKALLQHLVRRSLRCSYVVADTARIAALHFPFVLAIEPTFIEVRHVESGRPVQIIPGNNLRCLYADTPPSQTHSMAHYYGPYTRVNHYPQPGYNVPGRNPPYPPGDGAQGYPGQYPMYGYRPNQAPPFHRSQTYARDEMIIVSDDKVMGLRLAPPPNMRHQRGALSLDQTSGEGPTFG